MVAFKIASRSFVIVMYIDGVVGVVELTESSECDLSQEADSFCFAKKGFVANKQDELETFLILVLFFVVLVFLCRVDTSTSPRHLPPPPAIQAAIAFFES